MKRPDLPKTEMQRMSALRATGALFTPAEERFDRITRMATQLLDTPIALISLIAEQCLWFKSKQGIDAQEMAREISFCGHAILGDDTFIVEDATQDLQFFDNPLVKGNPNICFYAGHPLHALDGSRVGTLCVIDRKPRKFTPEQLRTLRDLAAIAETELQRGQISEAQRNLIRERDDLQRRASVDELTRLWNRSTMLDMLRVELARAHRGVPFCVAMIDVDYFKHVNDTYGHPTGDTVLTELAMRIRRAVREFDAVGRYGGEEFIALLSNCDINHGLRICERICNFVAGEDIPTSAGSIHTSVSIGLAAFDANHNELKSIVGAADAALYCAKAHGRNRVEVEHPQPG